MAFKEITFDSANGRDKVYAWGYYPYEQPKGVLQIIHGYGEHFRRFGHMIDRFVEAGFAVYGLDKTGFGITGEMNGTWGDPGEDGASSYLEDEKKLHDIAAQDFPGVPYFMFGFSMGSALTRLYAAKYKGELSGILMDGVINHWAAADKVLAEGALEAEIAAGHGEEYDETFEWITKIFFDGMNRQIPDAEHPMQWMSVDAGLLKDNLEDPLNMGAHLAQKRLLWTLMSLYRQSNSEEWADSMDLNMPTYLFGGDCDPSAGNGVGPYTVAGMMKDRGAKHVRVELNSGYRHEVHKEPGEADHVIDNMLRFVNDVLDGVFA